MWQLFSTCIFILPCHPVLSGHQHSYTLKHLMLLWNILEPELRGTLAIQKSCIDTGLVAYNDLGTIYAPGGLIYTKVYDGDCAMRMKLLECQWIESNGDRFGTMHHRIEIGEFPGFPIEFHPRRAAVEEALLKRGRMFAGLHGIHCKTFEGMAQAKEGRSVVKVQVKGRIVVDADSYFKYVPMNQPLGRLPVAPDKRNIQSCGNADEGRDPVDDDNSAKNGHSGGEHDPTNESTHEQFRVNALTSERRTFVSLSTSQLLQCSPMVKGYYLEMKRWLHFPVEQVKDVEFNSTALETLVMAPDKKELILALTESQLNGDSYIDDMVTGEAKGVILLLKGPSGVGKTLTAESVAESLQVPLFSLPAGEMGSDPLSLQKDLTQTLETISKWNAVLLIQECDILLDARDGANVAHNKLASAFLRTLESYAGIVFLTTNRVTNVDAAVESRIHVCMEYPQLNRDSRRRVWAGFLQQGKNGKSEVTEEQIDNLAQTEMNGRRIKHTMRMAKLLAGRKKVPLRFEHLQQMLKIQQKGQATRDINHYV